VAAESFAAAIRAVSRGADKLGAEAMLVDLDPAIALALPAVIVVFAAASSALSLAMIRKVIAAAAECARAAGVAPPIAVMNVQGDRAEALAQRLGVEVKGRGETCWLANGATVAHSDLVTDEDKLRRLAMTLVGAAQ
jgi:hypothetical protein